MASEPIITEEASRSFLKNLPSGLKADLTQSVYIDDTADNETELYSEY